MRLGNQKKKKNNKGFSLVELIVVVLIIAIIAVALAPQVMKWVGTAKTNVDENNKATLKSAVAVAVAEFQSKDNTADCTLDVNVDENDLTTLGATKPLAKYIKEVLNGDYPKTSNGNLFHIKIDSKGSTTITTVTPTPTP